MAHIHRKYIDSHWLTFISKGLLALLFGWLALFNDGEGVSIPISIISIFLLGLSIIEFGNALHRAHMATGWFVSVFAAIVDAVVAIILLAIINSNLASEYIAASSLIVIACFTVCRSLADIIIAFKTTVDPTDRFIWLLSGICGCIMGIVILNSGHLSITEYIRFFGAYFSIFGVCNLIYGVHNHYQKLEDSEARSQAARDARLVHTLQSIKKRKKSPKK